MGLTYKQKKQFIDKLTGYANQIKNDPDRVSVLAMIQKAFFSIRNEDDEEFIELTRKVTDRIIKVFRYELKEKAYWADRSRRREEVIKAEEELWRWVRFSE